MQIITFILVIMPLLYLISIVQSKKNRKILKKDFGILMGLSVLGVFIASILITVVSKGESLTFVYIIGALGASIIWGILVCITVLFLKKLLNK
ncbi:hypothetical protein [Mammaliicoccus sp. Dog046]|uniref:hypothetical protein n=1 Tax=Mammaliicoccus sp. Dog046 TaxID=3034233 RepID=UPI002B2636C7|nr:hypothetical protein [Mammaliicoccus sp. Dog046]WQK86498.1 hypothetical protein P3U32_05655 [Mammaliicoccus sp. Dog046]